MRQILINKKGFSLLETVASLVIISIILLSFVHFFMQSNRVTYLNYEKLIVTNLADSSLEEIQAAILPEMESTEKLINYLSDTYSEVIILNNQNYFIKISPSQNISIISNSSINEEQAQLINVKVTVYHCKKGATIENCDKGTSSSTEGYVSYVPIQ